MHIDKILNLIDKDTSQITFSKDWSQGRTTFGGLVAAVLYQKMRTIVDSERVLRSLNTQFIGPVAPEEEATITVEIIREGKNTSIAEARIFQGDRCMTAVTACFGLARESKISVPITRQIEQRPPKKRLMPTYIPKISPEFSKNYVLDVIDGGIPYTGRKKALYKGWMKFKKAPISIQDAHIISMIDAWPPTVLQMVKGIKPASTLSWNLEFLHPHSLLKPDGWLGYQAETLQAGDGYAHTEALISDESGNPIAISRQVVTIFD